MNEKEKMPHLGDGDKNGAKNGEFIPSYFNWITLDEQKKRSEELNNMTKNNKN